MNRFLLLLMLAAALALGGCATDLTPETNDRAPADYSPDPTSHVTQPARSTYSGGPI